MLNKLTALSTERALMPQRHEVFMQKDIELRIALFIDYDNIAIGLREAGAEKFEIQRVLERLLEKGRIIYKRAYADWSYFSEGKRALHEAAIEMIDIPMRSSIGKNSADIRLVVDALDLCYTKEHIDTFVIGSGDSDFSPLVSKLKENDKSVIGFGLRGSTSNLLANNCDEFIFYEDLVSLPLARPAIPPGLGKRQQEAFALLIDTVSALMRENKDVLWGSLIKDTIRRKRPSFSESQYGYGSFSQMLEDAARHGLIGLVKDQKSGGTPVVTGFGTGVEILQSTTAVKDTAPSTPKKSKSVKQPGEAKRRRSTSAAKGETKTPAARGKSSTAKKKDDSGRVGSSGDVREKQSKVTPKFLKKNSPGAVKASDVKDPDEQKTTATGLKKKKISSTSRIRKR